MGDLLCTLSLLGCCDNDNTWYEKIKFFKLINFYFLIFFFKKKKKKKEYNNN